MLFDDSRLVSRLLPHDYATSILTVTMIKDLLPWNDRKYDDFQNPRSYQQEDCVSCRVLGRVSYDDTSPCAKSRPQVPEPS